MPDLSERMTADERCARIVINDLFDHPLFARHKLGDMGDGLPLDFAAMEEDPQFPMLSRGERALFYFAWSLYTCDDSYAYDNDAGLLATLGKLDMDNIRRVLTAIVVRAGYEGSVALVPR